MPSSISSSEGAAHDRKTRRAIWLILVGIAVIGLTCEVAVNYGLHRFSKISRRIEHEYRDSLVLTSHGLNGKPTMLLLGNSLLLEAVNYPQLKSSLSDEFDVHRLVFEQTEYLEQYYALRTLFRHHSRPGYVVLCISVDHLSRDETRGEFMSRYMDAIDIASLGARKHDDPTTVSSQLFAHVSDWFANRAEIRKVLLGVAMPDVQTLTGVLAMQYAPPMSADDVRRKAEPHLQEMKELCERYGSRLVVVIPPTTRENHAEILISYGEALGIPVLMPEPVGAMGPDLFRDGLHLTPAGAEIFTAKLQPELSSLPRLSSSR